MCHGMQINWLFANLLMNLLKNWLKKATFLFMLNFSKSLLILSFKQYIKQAPQE